MNMKITQSILLKCLINNSTWLYVNSFPHRLYLNGIRCLWIMWAELKVPYERHPINVQRSLAILKPWPENTRANWHWTIYSSNLYKNSQSMFTLTRFMRSISSEFRFEADCTFIAFYLSTLFMCFFCLSPLFHWIQLWIDVPKTD